MGKNDKESEKDTTTRPPQKRWSEKGKNDMPEEKCILDPERDCKAKEVEGEVKALAGKLSDFQAAVNATNTRFGARIGKLEARDEVREEQYKNFREKMDNIVHDVTEFQREQKDSIAELRREHKESMAELKKGNKEILDIVTPLRHKVEEIDELEEDVEELKSKPAETWENVKKQALGWIVGAVLAILAAALGLSKFL